MFSNNSKSFIIFGTLPTLKGVGIDPNTGKIVWVELKTVGV